MFIVIYVIIYTSYIYIYIFIYIYIYINKTVCVHARARVCVRYIIYIYYMTHVMYTYFRFSRIVPFIVSEPRLVLILIHVSKRKINAITFESLTLYSASFVSITEMLFGIAMVLKVMVIKFFTFVHTPWVIVRVVSTAHFYPKHVTIVFETQFLTQ